MVRSTMDAASDACEGFEYARFRSLGKMHADPISGYEVAFCVTITAAVQP